MKWYNGMYVLEGEGPIITNNVNNNKIAYLIWYSQSLVCGATLLCMCGVRYDVSMCASESVYEWEMHGMGRCVYLRKRYMCERLLHSEVLKSARMLHPTHDLVCLALL